MSSALKARLAQHRQQDDSEGSDVTDAALAIMEKMIGQSVSPAARQQQAGAMLAAGIIPAGDGTLAFKEFRLSQVGVIAWEGTIFEDWNTLLTTMVQLEGSIQWIIGDLILMGEQVYGQTYDAIAALTGREPKTLRNYVYVASNVELSLRRDNLTFGHHALVAAMEPEHQTYWLEQAVVHNWSIAKLRDAMSGRAMGDGEKKPFGQTIRTWATHRKEIRTNSRWLDGALRRGVHENQREQAKAAAAQLAELYRQIAEELDG